MTPREKAEDLFSIFCIYPLLKEQAKYLCLKAVDEIKEAVGMRIQYKDETSYIEYWQKVKQEINNL